MREHFAAVAAISAALTVAWLSVSVGAGQHVTTTYDISTLAGKISSLNGTQGLQIRMSAFLQEEAEDVRASPSRRHSCSRVRSTVTSSCRPPSP
jgi:hypothetical protein